MRGLCIALFLAVALCVVAASPQGQRPCSVSPEGAEEKQVEKREAKTSKRAKTTKKADDGSSEENSTCNPAYAPKPGDKADVNNYRNKREANPDKKDDKKDDKKADKKGDDKKADDKKADDQKADDQKPDDKKAEGGEHKHHCTGTHTETTAAPAAN